MTFRKHVLETAGERPTAGIRRPLHGRSPVLTTSKAHSERRDGRQPLPVELLHNLRTPLNQIIGFSEMLAEQAHDEGQDTFVPDLQKIHSAGMDLLAIITNSSEPTGDRALGLTSASCAPITASSDVGASDSAVDAVASDELDVTKPGGLLLLVDDNEANRDVLSRRLKSQGCSVVTADSGNAALIAARTHAFDLVLLDIMMPEMDGYQVLKELKSDEALRHIPVVMISAVHEMDSVVRCIELGADDYLFKPFNPSLLKARVGACLDKKRARDREMQLFEQLQQNFGRLQELEKLRDDLTHMIVHDLRTPLTSVIAGMMTLEVVGELNDDQREVMNMAVDGGQTLLSMINDLLDVEKLESGSVQLDYVDLSADELVAAAVRQVASLAESKQITLVQETAAGLPPFRGDSDLLRRTLINLLGNAVKFTPAGGTVTVEAHLRADRQSIGFAVRDTGEGIPAESFTRIFEKFGQVAARKAGRATSTGLGLAFCKLAVEAHGGRIGVESCPGDGSKFTFAVPLAPVIPSAPQI